MQCPRKILYEIVLRFYAKFVMGENPWKGRYMIHPIALLAVVEVQQREVLERAKRYRRVQAASDNQAMLRKAQASLARCGQTESKNILPEGTLL
jgi:hypothetical protein